MCLRNFPRNVGPPRNPLLFFLFTDVLADLLDCIVKGLDDKNQCCLREE